MKEKYRKEILKMMIQGHILQELRTFPNERKMPIRESIFLNRIGKCCEGLHYFLSKLIHEGKLPQENLKFVDKVSREYADLMRLKATKWGFSHENRNNRLDDKIYFRSMVYLWYFTLWNRFDMKI